MDKPKGRSPAVAGCLLLFATACVTGSKADEPPDAAAAPLETPVLIPDPLHASDDPDTLTLRSTRQIAMYYRLDLHKDNDEAEAMAQVMRQHEAEVRTCYTQRLGDLPSLKGQVALTFRVPKETGSMEEIARTGGSLQDDALFRCIAAQLALLPFATDRDVSGDLLYTFEAREGPMEQVQSQKH